MPDLTHRVRLQIEGPEKPSESYPDRRYRDTFTDISVIVSADKATEIASSVHQLLASDVSARFQMSINSQEES